MRVAIQRIIVAQIEMAWGWGDGGWVGARYQAAALTRVKVDKSMRHLVYDSLLAL